jgi:hypothetical protein
MNVTTYSLATLFSVFWGVCLQFWCWLVVLYLNQLDGSLLFPAGFGGYLEVVGFGHLVVEVGSHRCRFQIRMIHLVYLIVHFVDLVVCFDI